MSLDPISTAMISGTTHQVVPTDRSSRSRQWHHKVKTGCLTCKQRRVKCSEERPQCSRCLSAGRDCDYGTQVKGRIFEPARSRPVSVDTLSLVRPGDYGTSDPEEVRALQFFLEVTAPAASTYNKHTKDFFASLIPQVARSEAAVRHLVVAVATRQESMASGADSALTLSRVQAKHYGAGLNALSQGKTTSEEAILIASALLITLGHLENPQDQKAQSIFHLMAGMRILIERLDSDPPKPSHIIETHVQPIFARLEMMMSLFMMPANGPEAVNCLVEPTQPVLPDQFSDLQQARETWFAICCWRYRQEARTNTWTADAECFRDIRALLLRWNGLLMAYAGKAAVGSPKELQRALAMISQFRLLFIAMMFSVRHDLHLADLVRPSFVNLLQPGEVSVTYHLPKRTLAMIPELDWETDPIDDAFQVRLWPLVEAVKRSEIAGLLRLTLKM